MLERFRCVVSPWRRGRDLRADWRRYTNFADIFLAYACAVSSYLIAP